MNIGNSLKSYLLELSQDLINLLTSPDNIKKYVILIQNIIDDLTSDNNSSKYDKLVQGLINKFIEPSNVERYKQAFSQLFKPGAVNAPKAGILDAEASKEKKELEGSLANKPLPYWSEPTK